MKLSGLWKKFRSSGNRGGANRNILRCTYFAAGLFLLMAAYFLNISIKDNEILCKLHKSLRSKK